MKRVDTSLLCCNFPTTVLLVDDNPGFLHNLTAWLEQTFICKSLANPVVALTLLMENASRHSGSYLETMLKVVTPTIEADDDRADTLSLKLEHIANKIYDKERFEAISCVVIDYSMPKLNGAELLTCIQELPIYKIMLTGEADEALAVDLFNQRIIDQFIVKKTGPSLRSKLIEAVHRGQRIYFSNFTKPISKIISNQKKNLLTNDDYGDIFRETCEKLAIKEYYLIDKQGSYVLIDKQGKFHYLLVQSEEDLQKSYEIARDSEAPQEILESLNSREKLLYLYTAKDLAKPVELWNKNLFPCKPILDEGVTFYYSLVSNHEENMFDANQIITAYPSKVNVG